MRNENVKGKLKLAPQEAHQQGTHVHLVALLLEVAYHHQAERVRRQAAPDRSRAAREGAGGSVARGALLLLLNLHILLGRGSDFSGRPQLCKCRGRRT